VRVCSICAVPEIVGAVWSDGGAAAITAVAAETAELVPAEFLAVTSRAIVFPTSACVSLYVVEVAALMPTQLAPVLSQRCHR
jgi:hypothetical protein